MQKLKNLHWSGSQIVFLLENQDLKTIEPIVLFLHSICWFGNFLYIKVVKKYSKKYREL